MTIRKPQRLFFSKHRAELPIRTRVFMTLAFVSLLAGAPARAAFSNYNSILIGSRASGMGGAFTALSGDSAATPFYNPATTVLLRGSSLSATVNVYNKYDTNYGQSSDFSEAPQRINRGFFRSIPSSSGTILNFKSFAFGISILVPDYEFYSGQLKGSDNTSSFLSHIDESLWVGGTFSTRLTERDSAGLSLYYTARNLTRSSSDRVTTGGGTGAIITNEEKNLTSNAVVAIVGYHRKLSDTWSFGISYRPPSLPIAGEASYYKAVTETNPYTSTVINEGHLRAVTKIPAKLAFGFAREAPGKNTISADLQIYEGLGYNDLPGFPAGTDLVDHKRTVNFAIGYEQFIRDWITLRLGFYSNLSSHPEPQIERGARQNDHIDMGGFSANLNLRTQEKTSFTFGGYYSGGSGRSMQLVGQQLSVIPKSQQTFTMLVATSFNF